MNAINPVKIMQIYSKYAHDNRGQGRGNMHADKTNKMLCVWFLNFSFKQAVSKNCCSLSHFWHVLIYNYTKILFASSTKLDCFTAIG